MRQTFIYYITYVFHKNIVHMDKKKYLNKIVLKISLQQVQFLYGSTSSMNNIDLSPFLLKGKNERR